jgi:catechol 2,3-dioxygenase-like lactoylglutathione lyase family enzyme
MPVMRLHHVQITIPRGTEEQAEQFYCGLLGLSQIEKPPALQGRGGFWLGAGDQQVHIGTEDGVDRLATKAHIAYEVDDLQAWRSLLQSHAISLLDSVPIPGYARFEIRDPFGNRIEFIQTLAG